LQKEKTIKGYQAMLLSAKDKDPDANLENCLKSTPIDFAGELVRAFTARGECSGLVWPVRN